MRGQEPLGSNASDTSKERLAMLAGKCKPETRALSCKIIHWTVHCWWYLIVLFMLE